MEAKVFLGAQPETSEEYQQEADRLLGEIRTMLDETKRSRERGQRVVSESQVLREQLRKRLLCGKA